MSNLVPVKRVDKNGVLTTKHVKADSGSAAAKSSIPAPALPGAVNKPLRAPSGTSVLKRFYEHEVELYGADASTSQQHDYVLTYLNKYSPEVRKELYDFIGTADRVDHDSIKGFLTYHYSEPSRFSAYVNTIDDIRWVNSCAGKVHSAHSDDSPENFRRIFENLKLNEWKEDLTDYHYGIIKAEHLTNELRMSPSNYMMPHDYYRELEAVRVNYDTISPALPVVMAWKKARDKAFGEKLQDPDLPAEERQYKTVTTAELLDIAEYANQYPEQVNFIADAITERGEFNRELIDSMMQSDATAVASGVL